MDPRLLTQLAVIVELGSVTKAARKLNVTQPTLSRSIKIIEDRVGGAVLHRGRYGVTPTEIGSQLAQEGRDILRRSDRARIAIQEYQHGLTGELKIGVGPMLAATVMGEFFVNAVEDPTKYSLSIQCEVASRLAKRLRDDDLDVAIAPFDLTSPDDGLQREMLFRDRLAVFVGKNDPLARRPSVSPATLNDYQWVTVGEISGLFDVNRETLDSLGLSTVTPVIENTGDVTMTLRILERTKSCAMLPARMLAPHRKRYGIERVELTSDLPTRNIGFWTTTKAADRPAVVDFFKRLKSFVASMGMDA